MRDRDINDLVYTSVFGNYDWVLPPVAAHPGVKHVLITDRDGPAPSGWERRIVDPADYGGPSAANRYWKMLGHRELPGFERTLYVDANIRLLGDSSAFLDKVLPDDAAMGLFRHPLRDTVVAEAQACAATGKVTDPLQAAAEIAAYHKMGFTDDMGLSENTIIARRPASPGLDDTMQLWWELYQSHSGRDQLSLPVARWHTGLAVYWIEWSFRAPNPWFAIYPHRGSQGVNPRYALMEARAHDSVVHAALLRAWRAFRAARRTMRGNGKKETA